MWILVTECFLSMDGSLFVLKGGRLVWVGGAIKHCGNQWPPSYNTSMWPPLCLSLQILTDIEKPWLRQWVSLYTLLKWIIPLSWLSPGRVGGFPTWGGPITWGGRKSSYISSTDFTTTRQVGSAKCGRETLFVSVFASSEMLLKMDNHVHPSPQKVGHEQVPTD